MGVNATGEPRWTSCFRTSNTAARRRESRAQPSPHSARNAPSSRIHSQQEVVAGLDSQEVLEECCAAFAAT